MTYYWRPIPEFGGSLPLAGGWMRFSRVERLARDKPPEILSATHVPDEVLDRLTVPRARVLGLSMAQPRLMGVVNVTPDSFSDGGRHDRPQSALTYAWRMLGAGAEILDIGGESTRPGAREVPVDEEIARILPVIEGIAPAARVSVDTRKLAVARAAVEAGAGLVNDVSAMDFDPAMARWAGQSDVGLCLMHAQGTPENMQDDPQYEDVLLDIYDALERRLADAEAAGVRRERVVLDPGIGFGKTQTHNLAILRRISLFHGLGCPLLLGVSRKRFIGTIGNAPQADARMPGTLAVTLAAVAQGVQIHRVHDVAAIRQGLSLWQALEQEGE